MDTRMLDVTIGLVMVFAVTSLFVTALQEIWASWRNTRGINLKRAIASMGGDDFGFTEKLYEHPLVRSLYVKPSGPSYMPSDVFSTALLSTLNQLSPNSPPARQGTPSAFLNSITVTAGSPKGLGALMESLQTLVAGVENDWVAFEKRIQAWYDHTGERSIGWFKRDTQVSLFAFGLGVAVLFNINAIMIGSALWNDEALRERSTALAKQIVDKQLQESSSAPVGLPTNAQSPAPTQTSAPLAVAATPNSSQLATNEQLNRLIKQLDDLAKQPSALKALATESYAAARRLEAALHDERTSVSIAPDGTEARTVMANSTDGRLRALGDALSGKRLPPNLNTGERAALISLQEADDKIGALVRNERLLSAKPLPVIVGSAPLTTKQSCDSVPNSMQDECTRSCKDLAGEELKLCVAQVRLYTIKNIGIPIGWGAEQAKNVDLANPVVIASFPLGWLITALAVTLGAPFWFDMLSKLVKVRASGAKISTDSSASGDKPSGTPSITAQPAAGPSPTVSTPSNDALNDEEQRLSEAEIQRIQIGLGMPNQKITGRLDGETRSAISNWQIAQQSSGTGVLTSAEIQTLLFGGVPLVTKPVSVPYNPDVVFEG